MLTTDCIGSAKTEDHEELGRAIEHLLVASAPELDAAIDFVLKEARGIVGADQLSVFLFNADRQSMACCAELVGAPAFSYSEATAPWIAGQVRAGQTVAIAEVKDLPEAAAVDAATLRRRGVGAALMVPLRTPHGEVIGGAGFAMVSRPRRWTAADAVVGLRFGALLASALLRLGAQRAREEELRFQQLAIDLTASLVELPTERLREGIADALRLTSAFTRASWAGAWQMDSSRSLQLMARWSASAIEPARRTGEAPLGWLVPRMLEALSANQPVVMAGLHDSPEKESPPQPCRGDRAETVLVLPLRSGKEAIGSLAFGRCASSWPEETVKRLQILSPYFSGTVARARDATGIAEREKNLRRLTADLLRVQDAERRRIAREIHDGMAQHVLGAALEADRLLRGTSDAALAQSLNEIRELCREALSELRAFSWTLHPPALEAEGLVPVMREYARGFAERTGLRIAAEIAEIERLPAEIELALFRVMQEALANAHRHSGARAVLVALRRTPEEIVLTIRDDGHGFTKEPVQTRLGVGVRGMQERLRQLGGSLRIDSSPGGAEIRAAVPAPVAFAGAAEPQMTARRNAALQRPAPTPPPRSRTRGRTPGPAAD
jgi:signal transduction histidine kinase